MCSLISTPIPPCHHFPSFPPSLPLLGHLHLSIHSRLSVEPSPQNQLKITFHLQIPSRDIRYLCAPQREKPFIFDSRLSRNGSNVSCNHDKCNQAGFWWANGWTRSALLCQEWYYIWQLCHIFLKSFSLISRQKSSWNLWWHWETRSFVSVLYCQWRDNSVLLPRTFFKPLGFLCFCQLRTY